MNENYAYVRTHASALFVNFRVDLYRFFFFSSSSSNAFINWWWWWRKTVWNLSDRQKIILQSSFVKKKRERMNANHDICLHFFRLIKSKDFSLVSSWTLSSFSDCSSSSVIISRL